MQDDTSIEFSASVSVYVTIKVTKVFVNNLEKQASKSAAAFLQVYAQP